MLFVTFKAPCFAPAWRGLRTLGLGLVVAAALNQTGCGRSASGGDPSADITEGWNCFRDGEYPAATTSFDNALAALDRTPDSAAAASLRLKALYGLAQTWDLGRREDDPAKAAVLYQRIIDSAPSSDEAAWSMLALARMRQVVPVGQEPDFPAVRKAYQDVIDHFPNHPAADEAFIYQQSTQISGLDPQQAKKALVLLSDFVRKHPDSKFVSAAWSLSAACQSILGDNSASLQADIRSFDTREAGTASVNTSFDAAPGYWHLATTAEFNVGDFATARKYYRKLIDEYPSDQKVFPAQQALIRMDKLENSVLAELKAAGSSSNGGATTATDDNSRRGNHGL